MGDSCGGRRQPLAGQKIPGEGNNSLGEGGCGAKEERRERDVYVCCLARNDYNLLGWIFTSKSSFYLTMVRL